MPVSVIIQLSLTAATVFLAGGAYCDWPTEINGSHMHCEQGGVGVNSEREYWRPSHSRPWRRWCRRSQLHMAVPRQQHGTGTKSPWRLEMVYGSCSECVQRSYGTGWICECTRSSR